MMFRGVSAVVSVLALWSAYLQLNDPDPERWFALYFGTAVIAAVFAAGRALPRAALALGLVALAWALAIGPELLGGWGPRDLTASMSSARPDIEYGREFGGLLIVAFYCLSAFVQHRRGERSAALLARQ